MAFALTLPKMVVWIVLIAAVAGIAMGLSTSARDTRNTQTVWDALLRQREPIHLTLDAAGRILEMTTLRWSDANPDRIYRMQPFGGRTLAHATHQGFTIPTTMEIGNLYGTSEYAPFFRARLIRVEY